MVTVHVNGKPITVEEGCNLSLLIKKIDLKSPYFAVALNERVVSKANHDKTRVGDGDRIEIIEPVGGG